MAKPNITPAAEVFLVAIVEVEKADRIICQAAGCGHGVYRRIHVVLVDGGFTLLGSDCFQRLYGATKKTYSPYYHWGEGRRLTDEERQRLVQNTAAFLEQLEAERQRHEENAIKVLEVPTPSIQTVKAESAPDRPRFYYNADDALASPYEGPAVLRWKWVTDTAIGSSVLASCKADSSLSSAVKVVVACYAKKKMAFKTPYLFVLEVELRHFMPKKTALRVLHELGLIEPN